MKLVTKTIQDTKARVKTKQYYPEKILTGVKQGDPLTATLFCIVIDDIIKQLELRGYISTRLKQCSAYADDILITSRTQETLIDTFGKLKDISLQYGLNVNENKKKYIKCTRKENVLGKLQPGNTLIDQVKSFSNLGSIVNRNNTLEEEIRERIAKGNRAFYTNRALF